MKFLISDMTKMTIIIVSLMILFTAFYIFLNRTSFFGERPLKEEKPPQAEKEKQSLLAKLRKLFKIKEKVNYDEPLPIIAGKSYNYSYTARLTVAPEETIQRYNQLKNHILSYANVTSSLTWKEETFLYRGKIVLKLRLQGLTMRLFLALTNEELSDTLYKVVDVSKYKEHEQTNVYYRIRTKKALIEALELIDLSFLKLNITKGMLPVQNEDFRLPPQKRITLLNEGLIKEVDAPLHFESSQDEGSDGDEIPQD